MSFCTLQADVYLAGNSIHFVFKLWIIIMHFLFIRSFSVCEWKTWTLLSVIFLPYFRFLVPCCFSYIYVCILSVSLCVFFLFYFFFLYKFTCFIANCWFIFYAKRRRFKMSQSWRLTNRFNFVFQWKILVYSWIFYPPFSFLTPIAIRLFILSFSTFYILYTRLAID